MQELMAAITFYFRYSDSNSRFDIKVDSSGNLQVKNKKVAPTLNLVTDAEYQDVSGWYNFVVLLTQQSYGIK